MVPTTKARYRPADTENEAEGGAIFARQTRQHLIESAEKLLEAQDRLFDSVVEIYRSLAARDGSLHGSLRDYNPLEELRQNE